jgi:hypothetical protein
MDERQDEITADAGTANVDDPATGALVNSIISAVGWQGLTITTAEGKPAMLAVVDEHGRIVECGPDVAREAWHVAVLSYRRFLIGEGCLRVYSSPTGIYQDERAPQVVPPAIHSCGDRPACPVRPGRGRGLRAFREHYTACVNVFLGAPGAGGPVDMEHARCSPLCDQQQVNLGTIGARLEALVINLNPAESIGHQLSRLCSCLEIKRLHTRSEVGPGFRGGGDCDATRHIKLAFQTGDFTLFRR